MVDMFGGTGGARAVQVQELLPGYSGNVNIRVQ